jgi:hypothetical protein
VLGDRQFTFFAASVSQYRQFVGSYIDLARRFQFAVNGFSQTFFYYAYQPGVLYDAGLGFLSRDQAIAKQQYNGGSVFGIYPFDRFRRIEMFGGISSYTEEYDNPLLQEVANQYQQQHCPGQNRKQGCQEG